MQWALLLADTDFDNMMYLVLIFMLLIACLHILHVVMNKKKTCLIEVLDPIQTPEKEPIQMVVMEKINAEEMTSRRFSL